MSLLVCGENRRFIHTYYIVTDCYRISLNVVVKIVCGKIRKQTSHYVAGWSSLVARWAHNPKVVGSNPAPATI